VRRWGEVLGTGLTDYIAKSINDESIVIEAIEHGPVRAE
jgi:hypothetical protein